MRQKRARNIVIGIQARSTSTRFPDKVNFLLSGETVLDRVISACNSSKKHLSRWSSPRGSNPGGSSSRRSENIQVVLCIPTGDKLKKQYEGKINIVEGPEGDVLTRYIIMARKFNSDLIVRVTADCPLLLPMVVSKHLIVAAENDYDYTSNVDEKCRTSADGYDCEVISRALLEYTDRVAKDAYDREHVTTLIRRERPAGFRFGFIINTFDRSEEKHSIDTKEDAERLVAALDRLGDKRVVAERLYGPENVFTFA